MSKSVHEKQRLEIENCHVGKSEMDASCVMCIRWGRATCNEAST